MGTNSIIAIVGGAIVIIIGLALWPVLNGATHGLYSYFRASCDDGSNNRFLLAYQGITGQSTKPGAGQYNADTGIHGPNGWRITGSSGSCQIAAAAHNMGADNSAAGAAVTLYNEQGVVIGADATDHSSTAAAVSLASPYNYIEPPTILKRFSGINDLLLTIIPVVSIAGFLGISGAKLYSYGRGIGSIGSVVTSSVFTLIGIVVSMIIATPILGQVVEANLVVESGQYAVNSGFGNILTLLFGMIPIVYIAGLVTIVGLQAKAALMGGRGGMQMA